MAKNTLAELQQLQALPLEVKILKTMQRIHEWVDRFGEDGVYVSFSGGKDSTVLLDIVRNRCGYANIQAVFVDTGLEYPEIREFVRTFDNVNWLKPEKNFKQVIFEYGYPFISKQVSKRVWEWHNAIRKGKDITKTEAYKEFTGTRFVKKDGFNEPMKSFHNKEKWMFLVDSSYMFSHKCCDVMKKKPIKSYQKDTKKVAITGQMASESINRSTHWLHYGCNAYEKAEPMSNPMSFWTEQDVLLYIKLNNLRICSVYGEVVEDDAEMLDGQMHIFDYDQSAGIFDNGYPTLKTTGCKRTGCMFCGFGCHLEKGEGRFETMKKTHPKQYEWIMKSTKDGGLGYKEVIDWLNEHGNLNIKY